MKFLLMGASLWAESPKEIIESSLAKQQINNSIQTVEMTLFSKNNSKQVRTFELKIRRDADAVRTYTKFISPADISGTQLVLVDKPAQSDPLLLFLPALKRVQRIAGRGRKGNFMGSDFAYADLELSLNGDETHTILEEDNNKWVIESKGSSELYSKWVSHVSKTDKLPRKIEYFDKKSKKFKTLEIQETRQEGTTVIPVKSLMTNHKKGTKTQLHIKQIEINLPADKLPLDIFTSTYLMDND